MDFSVPVFLLFSGPGVLYSELFLSIPASYHPFNSWVPTVGQALHWTWRGRGAPACHLFLLLPQAYSGGRQPLCPQLNLSKHVLGGRDDGSYECHKPEAPNRTIIAKMASSEAVDLSVQGQVLPLA